MTTKRDYMIVIAILAVLDVAAGFWYWAGHVNSDGKMGEDVATSTMAQLADTVPEGDVVPDRFKTIELSRYYVSRQPAHASSMRYYWSSIKRVKTRVPIEVNGNKALDELLTEMNRKAFGREVALTKECATAFVDTPTFNAPFHVPYKKLHTMPHVEKQYGHVQGIKIYPVLSSNLLLVMVVDKTGFNGWVSSQTMQFVIYDRQNQRVIKNGDIIDSRKHVVAMSIVNNAIDRANSKHHSRLQHITQLPGEMNVQRGGIYFVFQAGEIAPAGSGMQSVFVSYDRLKPCFTLSFAKLVARNGGFYRYTPIKFNKK